MDVFSDWYFTARSLFIQYRASHRGSGTSPFSISCRSCIQLTTTFASSSWDYDQDRCPRRSRTSRVNFVRVIHPTRDRSWHGTIRCKEVVLPKIFGPRFVDDGTTFVSLQVSIIFYHDIRYSSLGIQSDPFKCDNLAFKTCRQASLCFYSRAPVSSRTCTSSIRW